MKSKYKFLEIKMENESHGVFSATCGPLNLTIFFSSNFTLFSYYLSSLGTIKYYRMLLILHCKRGFECQQSKKIAEKLRASFICIREGKDFIAFLATL